MDLPAGIRQHGSGLQIRLRYKGIDYTQTINCKINKGTIANAVRQRSELKQRLQLGLPIASRDSDNIALLADVCQQWLNGLDVFRSFLGSFRCFRSFSTVLDVF